MAKADPVGGEPRRRHLPSVSLTHGTPRSAPHQLDRGRSPTRERGRPARILISGWRWRSDSATLPAGSHPAGVNCDGQSK